VPHSPIIGSTCMAPSAGIGSPGFFYVVRNPDIRQDLAKAAFGQSFLAEAPVNIVVCAKPERSSARYGERGQSFMLPDTAAAVLICCSWQKDSAWLRVGSEPLDEQEVSRALDIPNRRVDQVRISQ